MSVARSAWLRMHGDNRERVIRLVLAVGVAMVALTLTAAMPANGGVQGLVAAYGFDEGSGAVLHDASGNSHAGAISGATWVAGRNGGALAFNGSNASVDLGGLGSFYQNGFTLEAWVDKDSATNKDVAAVGSWAGNGPMLWVDHLQGHYQLTLGGSMSGYLDSGRTPVAGQWQHLTATFDGTTARYYIDGTEVANRTVSGSVGSSNNWRIGAYGSTPGGFFDGVIDDVRIYDHALTANQIQTDMNQPVAPDTSPPTTPPGFTATGGVGRTALAWGAADDDIGVTSYQVYRSTVSGFTPGSATKIGQTAGTSYTDLGLSGGTYYYKVTAGDAAGNIGPPSSEGVAVVVPDTTPPSVAITAPGENASLAGPVTLSAAATDDQGVAGVQFKVDGAPLGAEVTQPPYTLAWDTRSALNGPHTLTAVARDSGGNTSPSAPVVVNVANAGVSRTGLRAAYGFDDQTGNLAADASGHNNTGTLSGATWTSGTFAGAVALTGSASDVDLPALGTFYKTGFTYEAWVYKQSSKVDVGVVGAWSSDQAGGAMIWVDHITGHYRLTLGATFSNYLDSGRAPATGRWQHIGATYDGAVARFYVDGVQTASTTYTGNVGNSNAWRIGAYGTTKAGFFDGNIDNVRIYDRALTPSEIQTDMALRVQPDSTPPSVTSVTPASGATQVGISGSLTAKFDMPMQTSSITTSTFLLRDPANATVPATVTFDSAKNVATLTPQVPLQFGTTYHAVLPAGGATDLLGTPLASDVSWSFSTDASAPPVLVVTSRSNPFSSYLTEILRNEGMDEFTTVDASLLTSSFLNQFNVVLVGDMALTAGQVSALTGYVTGGGNLVAMHPDKQLAGLLGLSDAGATLANAYLKVDTTAGPGVGIVGSTIQYHGSADRYTLNGATEVATLYSDATTATGNPAVTLHSLGGNGGQAAAFSYDLARSVVYTRQGNPAWAGQERDGVTGIRSDDLFFGAKAGDVQPDWLDTSRIAIPQADEQERLLVNLITQMAQDQLPLPHFWYLPRGEKAVVVMSGDDHSPDNAPGGTASIFDRFQALSPPGCVIANWECIRGTSYIYPDSLLTATQIATYTAAGFELALHPVVSSCPTASMSMSALSTIFDNQLSAIESRYPFLPAPVSSRTHCVYWPDWASEAKVELAHGIRMDANYYHYPSGWIGAKPGFLNGGGFPMRFADLDGTTIDVYQQNTNMDDEAGQVYPATVDTLLDNALGPLGYYGAFGANIHTDNPAPNASDEAIVASAQARGVPIISYKQMLEWTDGRNNSTLRNLAWSAGTLTFTATVATGANGLQTMLPIQGPSGTLSALSRNGSAVVYTTQTIKGIQYAVFDTASGTYTATYS